MAKGAELVVRGGCPPHMVYVRVAQDLKARSWGWSQPWHKAYKQAVSHLRRGVAECVLKGLPVISQAVVIPLPAGACIEVRVTCSRTRIVIHVLDFVGPHDPGPDGGTWQPRPADGSAHGAYSTGGELRLVAFYEPMPGERPVDIRRGPPNKPCLASAGIQRDKDDASHVRRLRTARPTAPHAPDRGATVFNPRLPGSAPWSMTFEQAIPGSAFRMAARRTLPKDADWPVDAACPISRSQTFVVSTQAIISRVVPVSALQGIGMKCRLQSHAGIAFEPCVPQSAFHARHLPHSLRSGDVPSPFGSTLEPRLH